MMDISRQTKIAQHQSTKQLKQRISQGYRWLKEHIDDPRYPEHLQLYEILVTEIKKRGLTEEECWTTEALDEEEIEEIFQPPKSGELFNNLDK